MAVSPLNNFMVFMTYVDVPAMFTPWLNIIDLESNKLIDCYALFAEDTKPSFLAFASSKPDGYFRSDIHRTVVGYDFYFLSRRGRGRVDHSSDHGQIPERLCRFAGRDRIQRKKRRGSGL